MNNELTTSRARDVRRPVRIISRREGIKTRTITSTEARPPVNANDTAVSNGLKNPERVRPMPVNVPKKMIAALSRGSSKRARTSLASSFGLNLDGECILNRRFLTRKAASGVSASKSPVDLRTLHSASHSVGAPTTRSEIRQRSCQPRAPISADQLTRQGCSEAYATHDRSR
jgi:hypothetical protein